MNLEVLNWIVSALAFIGTIFNSRRNKTSQLIWAFTNLYMAWQNFHMNIPSIGTLYIAYFILAVYGFFVWNKKEKNQTFQEKKKKNRKFYKLYRELIENKNTK